MFLIEDKDWREICYILNYSERQLRDKKNQAIKSIAVAIWGYKVLNEDENLLDMV